ncbi:hypothetical protein M758_7G024100 [Ceratodon purpureus]|uniref:Amino acid transporter transmembrane domain-containing protein n=1 Tax=Ceratodon purpureus TaxID=3225 RepID=A0A8T0H6L7_CERPU|nr:hypothetical protein KC19_7G025100 [Ceratodon purpureus]KAG0609922.1 hypothetical protein M758_7G024100 [Ceratodon purpureus]
MEASRERSGVNFQPWVSIFNLCNAVVGAGVLSFPFAFRQSGIYGGLFYTGLIWLIEVGALCILVRAAENNRSRSYQELVASTLGPRLAVLTSATILLFVLGAMISFLIITGDVFQPIFAGWFGNDSALSDRRFVITVFAVVVVLPLSLKRSLRELKWTSTISVIMLTYLTVALSTLGVAHLVDDGISHKIKYFSGGMPAFIAIDIVVFSFQSHIQVIPIFAELAENPWPFIGSGRKPLEERLLPVPEGLNIGRPLTRVRSIRLRRMDGIILISMTICFVGYCLVGEFGYILFPDVESDVLKSFGSDNSFMNVARIGMCLVALACYPLQCYPARSILDDAIKHVFHRPGNESSRSRHILLTLLIFISTLVTALLITDLGTVFTIVGATGGVMVIFVIPGLLLVQQGLQQTPPDEEAHTLRERLEESLKWIKLIAGPLFLGLGVLIFVVTAYITAKGR